MLLGSAAERHLWLGDYQAAENSYGDALALASSIGDLSARPLLLAELGWVALLRGEVVTAERLSVEATELAEDLGNRRVWAHALRLKGEALLRRGDLAPPPPRSMVHSPWPRSWGRRRRWPACAVRRPVWHSRRGVWTRRAAWLGEATALSTLPHTMRRVSIAWVLGVAALMEGDLDAAEREFQDRPRTRRGGSDPFATRPTALWGLARVSADAGRLSQAAELHQRALALRHRMGDRLGVVDSLVGLATVSGTG